MSSSVYFSGTTTLQGPLLYVVQVSFFASTPDMILYRSRVLDAIKNKTLQFNASNPQQGTLLAYSLWPAPASPPQEATFDVGLFEACLRIAVPDGAFGNDCDDTLTPHVCLDVAEVCNLLMDTSCVPDTSFNTPGGSKHNPSRDAEDLCARLHTASILFPISVSFLFVTLVVMLYHIQAARVGRQPSLAFAKPLLVLLSLALTAGALGTWISTREYGSKLLSDYLPSSLLKSQAQRQGLGMSGFLFWSSIDQIELSLGPAAICAIVVVTLLCLGLLLEVFVQLRAAIRHAKSGGGKSEHIPLMGDRGM
jgi:hypothetical protein